jgi:putative membrane protein
MKRMFVTAGLACALAVPGLVSAQTSGAATPPHSAKTSQGHADHKGMLAAADKAFATEAAMGGMAEVELGKLAVEKASNADVKQFGQRMVDDHGKANDELKAWASQNNVTLPAELGAKHKATHARLAKLSGDAFDKAYMRDMVADHNKDVAAFQRASKTAKNADLKAWAAKTLPTLQEHQKLSKEINAKVAGGTTAGKTPKK